MGKAAKSIVRLTDAERHTLQQLVVGPRVARDKALRARMLLKADVDAPAGMTGRSPTHSMSGYPLSIGCASGSSRAGWMPP